MREIPVHNEAGLAVDRLDALRSTLQPLRTLGDVLAWSRHATQSRHPVEIVTQDEYTHDVVFQLDAAMCLVFDTT